MVSIASAAVGMLGTRSPRQVPRDLASAQQAALALPMVRTRGIPTERISSDSAALWRRFVRCSGRADRRACVVVDDRPFTWVRVVLVAPDTARVEVRDYELVRLSCPGQRVFDPPFVGAVRVERSQLVYRAGAWVPHGRRQAIVC